MFNVLKGSKFYFPFAINAACVVPSGGSKKSPRTSSVVQIIFSFWSFEIREDILRNQKKMLHKIHFLTNVSYVWPHFDYNSLYVGYPVENYEITVFLFGSMLPNL